MANNKILTDRLLNTKGNNNFDTMIIKTQAGTIETLLGSNGELREKLKAVTEQGLGGLGRGNLHMGSVGVNGLSGAG